MLTFYFLCLIIIILLIIGGFDATMRLVSYLDLQVTYLIIRIRSYFFMIKVRRNLLIDRETLLKDLEKTMPNKDPCLTFLLKGKNAQNVVLRGLMAITFGILVNRGMS